VSVYPNEREALIGQIEALQGFSCMLGPLVGSTLYTFFGYSHTYLAFGSVFLIYGCIVKQCMADKVDGMQQFEEDGVFSENGDAKSTKGPSERMSMMPN